jgi:hypothetical protein
VGGRGGGKGNRHVSWSASDGGKGCVEGRGVRRALLQTKQQPNRCRASSDLRFARACGVPRGHCSPASNTSAPVKVPAFSSECNASGQKDSQLVGAHTTHRGLTSGSVNWYSGVQDVGKGAADITERRGCRCSRLSLLVGSAQSMTCRYQEFFERIFFLGSSYRRPGSELAFCHRRLNRNKTGQFFSSSSSTTTKVESQEQQHLFGRSLFVTTLHSLHFAPLGSSESHHLLAPSFTAIVTNMVVELYHIHPRLSISATRVNALLSARN